MEKIFKIASQLSTPLALGGFFSAAVFLIFRQIVARNIFPRLTETIGAELLKLIVDRLFTLALVAMILGFFGYMASFIWPPQPLPKPTSLPSPDQQNQLKAAVSDMTAKYALIDIELGEIRNLTQRAIQHFTNPKSDDDFEAWYNHRKESWNSTKKSPLAQQRAFVGEKFKSLPSAENIQAFYDVAFPTFVQEIDKYYTSIGYFLSLPQNALPREIDRIFELNELFLKHLTEYLYYGLWNIVYCLPKSTTETFDKQWTNFTNSPVVIPSDAKQADNFINASLNKYEKYLLEYSSLVGRENLSLKLYELKVQQLLEKSTQGNASTTKTH